MLIETTRFGPLDVAESDVILFPDGMLGLSACRDWVLVADAQNPALGWLQSAERADIALAVVSPRRFVPDYQLRITRRELTNLALEDLREAQVLVIVGKSNGSITLNLKAPLVINVAGRRGRQVIHSGDEPLQHYLQAPTPSYRKSA